MTLRFLVDEDTPVVVAAELGRCGHDAVHCRDAGLLGRTDDGVIAFARREKRILITRDLGFGDVRAYPERSHSGIILLRVPTTYVAGQIVGLVRTFLEEVDQSALPGALVVVRPTGYRIRREKPDRVE